MPRVELPRSEFFSMYEQDISADGIARAERLTGVRYIGEGIESLVVVHPDYPGEVVAASFLKLPSEEAKIQFYLQRIMHTLFPHNFPRFAFATGGRGLLRASKGRFSGTIRERIRKAPAGTKVKYPFETALVKCEAMGIPLYLTDISAGNKIVGNDGGEYYVDNLGGLTGSLRELDPDNPNWKLSRIMSHMRKNGYSDDDRLVVASSLSRAIELADQAGNSLSMDQATLATLH